MLDWFNKTLPKKRFFFSEEFVSWKKVFSIYTRMLEFTFPREDVID